MAVLQAESVADIIERAMAWAEHRKRFTNLEDGSIDARQARIMYDARRRNVLEAMDWNFARHRAFSGQAVVETPTPDGMPYAFSTPPNCLRVRNCTQGGKNLTWRREALIYTNGDAPQIIFTGDETNAALFMPGFVLALEYLLAAQFAMVYARSVNRSDRMLANFRDAMREADQMEGAERSNDDA
ncbi:MAG: hypothetical protein AAF252_15210, partial [Pseudomonadota bacterium]